MAGDVIARWAERMRDVYMARRGAAHILARRPGVEMRWFRRLAAFAVEERVPAPLTYAAWLAAHRIRPGSWCSRETLRAYLRDLPRFESREDASRRLREAARRWCEERGIAADDPVAVFAERADDAELGRMLRGGEVPPRALAEHRAGRARLALLPDDVRISLEDAYGIEEVAGWTATGRDAPVGEGGRIRGR